MPAFLTHYACGVQGYRHLRAGQVKSAVGAHLGVYAVGLAGPDLFFYSIRELTRPGMTLGRIMHKYRTGRFLRALYARALSLRGEERETALAYFAGFLGHYCLDSNAHALVYYVTDADDQREALGKHFRYEAAIDVMCCRKVLGRDINHSHQMGLIRTSGREKRVIAHLLSGALREVYPDAPIPMGEGRIRRILREYVLISGLLIDPSGFREWTVYQAERRLLGYPLFAALCINRNRYGLELREWRCFRLYFDRGVHMLDTLLDLMEASLETESARETFFRRMGSWSYHGFHHEEADSDLPLARLEELTYQREREHKVLP